VPREIWLVANSDRRCLLVSFRTFVLTIEPYRSSTPDGVVPATLVVSLSQPGGSTASDKLPMSDRSYTVEELWVSDE
jgi:hypothetical protein